MPGYSDVCLWVQSFKLDALKKALAEKGLKLEDKLHEKMEDIYREYVPEMQRKEIEERLAAVIREEQEDAARRAAEQYRESVLKVIEAGCTHYWKIASAVSDLHIARLLRKALRDSAADPARIFDELLGGKDGKTEIESKEFARVSCMFLRGEKNAANTVTLDFDRNLITLAKSKVGYHAYRMKDASTAIYQADRAYGISEQKSSEKFYQHLDGKAVQSLPWTICVSRKKEGAA